MNIARAERYVKTTYGLARAVGRVALRPFLQQTAENIQERAMAAIHYHNTGEKK